MVNRSFCSPPECGLHGIRLTWESYYCKLNQKNWLQYTRNQDMRWFEISCFSFFNYDFNYYHPEYLPDHVPTIGLPCNASCIMLLNPSMTCVPFRTILPSAYLVLHCARFPHQQTVGTSSITSAISKTISLDRLLHSHFQIIKSDLQIVIILIKSVQNCRITIRYPIGFLQNIFFYYILDI